MERQVESLDNAERHQSHQVDDYSTETVSRVKKVEALGAFNLLSGGSASLAVVDDLHQAFGRDLNLVVGQMLGTTVSGDLQALRNCTALDHPFKFVLTTDCIGFDQNALKP